jgi:DNA-binding transcriptional MocR family regulator
MASLADQSVVQPLESKPSTSGHALRKTVEMLTRESDETLVDQLVTRFKRRMDERMLKPGAKLPSIRMLAQREGVSRFTVVEAYDRLVGQGLIESRRGSGFFVKERVVKPRTKDAVQVPPHNTMDTVWLLRNMFREVGPHHMPGTGTVPPEWLDAELIAHALRAYARGDGASLLSYGTPQGWLPLREQLTIKLAELEIDAAPQQIVTTSGITQALTMVARQLARPGDTVLVDDPGWFVLFASLNAQGLKIVGVPHTHDGQDINALARICEQHKPKFYVINSVLHNPTGHSLSAAKAFQILRIAEQHDFHIVEDDVYCDFHPGAQVQNATRLASLDQLKRVVYLGSFAKTLAANLRVGFVAADVGLAGALTDQKMLLSLTTPEMGERVVQKVLSEGHYRKHVERVRAKLEPRRAATLKTLENVGVRFTNLAPCGLFLWGDLGVNSEAVANAGAEAGFVFAPGSLFSPDQKPSTMMRFNAATSSHPQMLKFLAQAIENAQR